MNILLCLLSEQHVPNLLSVHHFLPEILILLESAAMKKRAVAEHFLKALRLGGIDHEPPRVVIEPLEAEDEFEAVRTSLRGVHAKYPNAAWTVNLTGGTKLMSIAAYEVFKPFTNRCVYTNVARPGILQFVETHELVPFQHRLTIAEFLAGYGFELMIAERHSNEDRHRALAWYDCAREIAALAPSHALLNLLDEEQSKGRAKGLQLDPRHLPNSEFFPATFVARTFGLPAGDQALFSRKLSKYEVEFLTGGWLEDFFFGFLHKYQKELQLDDISLSVGVRRMGDETGNDLDVAFIHNCGFHVLECKSGSQHHDRDGDVLYKIEAVVKQFRAAHVHSYLATTGRNLFTKDGQIKSQLQTRASIYNCALLTGDAIKRLAAHPSADEARTLLGLSHAGPAVERG
jgi:Domain of unknown function (DUF1887)